MIIVAGQMELTPAEMPALEQAVQAMRHKVLAEEGCSHYSLLVEDAARGLVNVTEYWSSDSALLDHLKQPWTAAFFDRFGGHLRSSTVQIYDVAGARPLPGM